MMACPKANKTFFIIGDAATGTEDTKGGLGAILCQTDETGQPRAISYASRSLSDSEKY